MIKRLEISTAGVFTLGELRDLVLSASVFPDDARVMVTGIPANGGDDMIEVQVDTEDYEQVAS